MNNRDDKSQLSFYRPEEHRWWKSPKKIGIGLGVVAALGLSFFGLVEWNHYQIEQQAAANQKKDSKNLHKVSTHAEKLLNKDISFDQNSDIPDAATLKKYRSLSDKLSFDGYITVPKQAGVTTPILLQQINEGSSNKVLAYGAGTVKPNQIMGQNNYAVAAHNFGFGGGKYGFSPMQKAIDVDAQPKVYLSNGKNIVVYQLNKKSDELSGRQVVSYHNGSVANDDRVKDTPLITLITCDEPGAWNNHPENRIVMTGHLVKAVSFNGATDYEKSLFPAFNQ